MAATQLFSTAQTLASSRSSTAREAPPFPGETSAPPDEGVQALSPAMTIADFVANVFVPEHVMQKKVAGQTHYRAMLKHVLTPESVNRLFQAKSETSKLRAVPSWPYMDNVRLCDAGRDHVERLISAAGERGYSGQTATHIRSVVSAIFAVAARKRCFSGENPASRVPLPEISRKERHTLSLDQVNQVLDVMRYPEKEMALMAMLMDMSMAEICSLQWKHVNLSSEWRRTGQGLMPPWSIVLTTEGRHLQLDKRIRQKTLLIPEPVIVMLLGMRSRERFTGDDDFVLVSRRGTPISAPGIVEGRLKRIGSKLAMPWLSWHVFRRAHTTLAHELGMQLLEARCGSPAFERAKAFISNPVSREKEISALKNAQQLSSLQPGATSAAEVAKIEADLKDLGNKLCELALKLHNEGLQTLHKLVQFAPSEGALAELTEELGSVRETLAQTKHLFSSIRKLAISPPTDAFLSPKFPPRGLG